VLLGLRTAVAGGLTGLFRYGESELDPAVQAEILLESARNEARAAVLEIILAFLFGLFLAFDSREFRFVAFFAVATVVPLLVDSQLRRAAARRLLAKKPGSA
jgi:ABC-type spermidine/putrescine transport system permease subunit I